MDDTKSHPLSRAWEWWHSDSGRRIFVGLVWAALVALAAEFVAQYARDWPVNDEWAFVGDFLGGEKPRLEWIFERHAEHRYPVARAILVLIDETCGHDYRIAMGVNVALLAGASGFLILSARRIRGTTEYTDCLFPALLLHRGHCEDMLMGYQIAFIFSEFCVATFVLALSGERPRPRLAAVAVLGLAGGGGPGILFAIPLGLAILAVLTHRRTGVFAGLLTLAALGAAGFQLADSLLKPPSEARNGIAKSLRVVLEVADGAFGRATDDDLPSLHWALGALVLVGGSYTAVRLILSSRRDRNAHRQWGLLGVLAGTLGFLLAVGHSRDNGLPLRFAAFSQFAVAVTWIWGTRFCNRRRWRVVAGAVLTTIVAGLVVRQNWGTGMQYGAYYANAYEDAAADARRGVPIDWIAERNHYYYFAADTNSHAWRTLRERGVAPFSDAPAGGDTGILSHGRLSPDPDGKRWRIQPDESRGAGALRLRGTRPEMAPWILVHFRWIEIAPDGLETERSEYRRAWRNPGPWTALLWIEGRCRDVVFETEGSDRPLSAQWLIRPRP